MTRKDNLRTSTYLNVVDVGEGFSLLYNGFTSRIDLVPSDVARQLLSDKGWRVFSFLSPGEALHLVNRGHLTGLTVRREREEFRKLAEHVLKTSEEVNQRINARRAIAFILTYQCNLSCAYCYQSEVRKTTCLSSMSEAFVDDFFRIYLEKLFPGMPGNSLRFILYGGEPLLYGNRGTIERILRYAKEHGIVVSMVTNAVLLPKMLDLIGPEEGKINNVQVTLDGGQMFHDQTRVSQSGAPTFEEIIRSLRALMKVNAHASIRIHLHPDRLESARELAEYLDREGILGHDNVNAYFAPINSFDGREVSLSCSEQFSELFQNVAFLQGSPPSSFARSFAQIIDERAMRSPLKSRYCATGADLLRVVDSCGDIYACYEEAGYKSRRIGILAGGGVRYFKLRDTYKKRHILNMPECLKCSIALFCGGGCMSQARVKRGSIFKPFCQQNKEFVGQTLKAYFLLKLQGKPARELNPFVEDER